MASQQQMPSLGQIAFGDLQTELDNTRRILERVPDDKLSWKPHEKSMSLGGLAQHVATLPQWFQMSAQVDHVDLAGFTPPPEPTSTAQIIEQFETHAKSALDTLAEVTPDLLGRPWSLRRGEQVFFTIPTGAVMRSFCINHLIHHRAQLTVYLRLLNMPVPGLYGPSADEK